MSEEVIKAVIASLGTVLVAGLALAGVVYSSRRPSKTKPPVGETKGLEEFNGTQNEFMALVIADNKDLRTQQAETKALVNDLQRSVNEIKQHNESFLGAVRRYLMKLATAWLGPEPMPWPDEADFHILEETLPSRPAGGAIIIKEEP